MIALLFSSLDSNPNCSSNIHPDGVIGPNSCGLEPETLELSCKVLFHGNQPPVLIWKISGEDTPVTKGVTNGTLQRSVAYNLTITANLNIDGSNFVCQTFRSRTNQHSCTTDTIKVMCKSRQLLSLFNIKTDSHCACLYDQA